MGSIAAFVGLNALKNFGEQLTHANAEAGKLSQTLEIEPRFLKAFEGAAVTFGASAEDADGILRNLTKTGQDLKNGIMPSADAMVAFGRAAQKANEAGANVDTSKFFDVNASAVDRLKLVNQIASHLSATEATNLFGRLGFSESQVRYLQAAPDALKKEVDLYEKLNPLTKEQTDEAIRLQAEWGHIGSGVDGVGNAILHDLNPALSSALVRMQELISYSKKHIPETEIVVGGLAATLGGITIASFAGLLGGLGAVGAALSGITVAGLGILAILSGIAGYKLAEWLDHKIHPEKYLDKEPLKDNSHGLTPKMIDANKRVKSHIQLEKVNLHGDRAKLAADAIAEALRDAPNSQYTKDLMRKEAARQMAESMGNGNSSGSSSNDPRGIRNNNPGNLNFAGQAGATLESGVNGRFAVFKTMDEGLAALANQLQLYAKRGNDTVKGIISVYAPKGDHNNTEAYAKSIAKDVGVDENAHLNLNDPEVLKKFMAAIFKNEGTAAKVDSAAIDRGISMNASSKHIAAILSPGASIDKSLMMGAGASSSASPVNNNQSSNATHVETHIGNVNVNAPNAKTNGDVANEIGKSMESYAFASNANLALA